MKQAAKMQRKMEEMQGELAETVLDVSAGGGAVAIKINGQGEFQSLTIDPEFLKEEADLVQETLLEAIRDAAAKAKAFNEEKMSGITSGLQMPGFM